MEPGNTPKRRRGQDSICLHEGPKDSGTTTGHPESQQPTGSSIIRLCMEIYLKIDKIVEIYKKLAKMGFIGQETVRKQQRQNLS